MLLLFFRDLKSTKIHAVALKRLKRTKFPKELAPLCINYIFMNKTWFFSWCAAISSIQNSKTKRDSNTKLLSHRHLQYIFYSIYFHMALKSEFQTMTACFKGYSTLTLRNTILQCIKIISLGAFLCISSCIAYWIV